ncbi:hypothetical protein XH88_07145 [Bradyrhizobium sp. CCBAU 51627]|nr:hypothetical protein [Bradyrhizobium sp. CCBAU 51627]
MLPSRTIRRGGALPLETSVIISIAIFPFRRRCMLMIKRGRPGKCHRRDEQPIDGFDSAFCYGRVIHSFLPALLIANGEA